MSIQPIDHGSIHRLTSGQVIIDLQSAVKELVDNALDAGSTSIQLLFREYGLELIEVQDDGRGIDSNDWPGICLKHHTSKLQDFSDLESVATLGFRGEALSSLCGTSDVSMITSTASTAPIATQLFFSTSGECIVGSKTARPSGTTVSVKNLFKTLPVRRKDLEKNAKKEFTKVIDLVQAYAIIKTGIRFEVKHSVKGKTSTHLQTVKAPTIRANYSSIFSPRAVSDMIDIVLELKVDPDHAARKWDPQNNQSPTAIQVHGLISKLNPSQGRSSSTRGFLYVNGRPIIANKISRGVNEVYKQFNSHGVPAFVMDFQMEPDTYDVNVSPDKRTIFFHREGNLIAALKSSLERFFDPVQSHYQTTSNENTKRKPTALEGASNLDLAIHDDDDDCGSIEIDPTVSTASMMRTDERTDDVSNGVSSSTSSSPTSTSPLTDTHDQDSRPRKRLRASTEQSDVDSLPSSSTPATLEATESRVDKITRSDTSRAQIREVRNRLSSISSAPQLPKPKTMHQTSLNVTRIARPIPLSTEPIKSSRASRNSSDADGAEDESQAEDSSDEFVPRSAEIQLSRSGSPESVAQVINLESQLAPMKANRSGAHERLEQVEVRGNELEVGPIELDCETIFIAEQWSRSLDHGMQLADEQQHVLNPTADPSSEQSTDQVIELRKAGVSIAEVGVAEEALSLAVNKNDFSRMVIVGQFNHAFIIVRRTVNNEDINAPRSQSTPAHDDLFIIDQHASDEKYNFENLQATTIMKSQRLLQPRVLNLPPHDELIAIDNVESLHFNGFEVIVDEDAAIGQRVKLSAQPVSGSTTLGITDLEELLNLIAGRSGAATGNVPRPSKIRRMFASRACRKSVMFGHPLTVNQMDNIVRHMGTMNQPWSCPHGRPTMRWLSSLSSTDTRKKTSASGRNDVRSLVEAAMACIEH